MNCSGQHILRHIVNRHFQKLLHIKSLQNNYLIIVLKGVKMQITSEKLERFKKQLFYSGNTCIQQTVEGDKNKKTVVPKVREVPTIVRNNNSNNQKQLACNYLHSYVINKIECNRCYQHDHLIFYIPAVLSTAQHLTMYNHQMGLHSYQLFTLLIKRINQISKQLPKQMTDSEIVNYLTIAINYKKNPNLIKQTLKQFLSKYQLKMKGFMPIYYLYFKMLSDKDELLPPDANIPSAVELIKTVEQQFRKYHDETI